MKTKSRWMPVVICGLALATICGGTGCQVSTGGQSLPSPYYLTDDVQFYGQGSEFKLSREAAAIKAYAADQAQQQQRGGAQRP